MTVSRLRPHALHSTYLEPKLRREAILEDVVHRVMSIPPADHKHGVFNDNRRMAEPLQRLRSRRLDQLPLVLLLLKGAPPKVVVPFTTIVAGKYVH